MSIMNNKKWIKVWMIISIGIPTIYLSGMLYLDPMHIFHKAPFPKNLFYRNIFDEDVARQNAGIINNYDFDSIILGSSMLQNTSAEEASSLLESNFVNLSSGGALTTDRALWLEYALKKKTINNAILALNGFSRDDQFSDWQTRDSYDFLYNDYYLDDIKIYLNKKYFLAAVCQIYLFESLGCKGKFKTIEDRVEWFSFQETYNNIPRFGGIDNWISAADHPDVKSSLEILGNFAQCQKEKNCQKTSFDNKLFEDHINSFSNVNESFDNHIFKYAELYQNTNFNLIFPPFPRITYAIWEQSNTGVYDDYISAISYIIKKSESVKNISVYGFDDMPFVDNINNYIDLSHHHPDFNSMILKSIRDKKHILTSKNVKEYINTIKLLAQTYDISKILDKIPLTKLK